MNRDNNQTHGLKIINEKYKLVLTVSIHSELDYMYECYNPALRICQLRTVKNTLTAD